MTDKNIVTIWVTKYWETKGILNMTGYYSTDSKAYFQEKLEGGRTMEHYMPGAFNDLDKAVEHVSMLAKRKKEKLLNQIKECDKWII